MYINFLNNYIMENKCLVIIIVLLTFYILHLNLRLRNVERMRNNTIENMANEEESLDDKIKGIVRKVYLADINAIRNLSEVSKKLQSDGLEIPGDLKVKGKLIVEKDANLESISVKNQSNLNGVVMNNLTVNKDSLVKGTTTINTLDSGSNYKSSMRLPFGGRSISKSWKVIKVKGDGLAFDINNKKFGFNSNGGLHYQEGSAYKQMPMYQGANMSGNLKTNNLEVSDYIGCKRLDIRNPDRYIKMPFGLKKINLGGTTHFNYNNTGEFYIRGIKKQANGLK